MIRFSWAPLALLPCLALTVEASPFEGSWRMRVDAARFSTKPVEVLIARGRYSCASCVPAVDVAADGTDQPVSGHDYYDTVAVQAASATSIRVVSKKAGKIVYEDSYAVSDDGQELRWNFSDRSSPRAVSGAILLARASTAPPAAHAASGSWKVEKIESLSDGGARLRFVSTADGLKMTSPAGRGYDAKFDGVPVALRGDTGHTRVALMKLNAHEFEETDRRNGMIVAMAKYSVSEDGKTLTITDHDTRHNRTDVFVLDRQTE
jgi:hypothetical protein